ncbi:MAG TPA: 6-phosphogluconolactonase, partial [Tepidiformaceae bacterium]|nr:6-phosphogluconolactonase [Tepidiformaceae bacterium]
RALAPDGILLPAEPYRFGLKHLREFEALAPLVLRVPGEWLWWYGPRIGSSVRALRRRISGMGRPSVRVVRPEAFAAAAADLVIGLAKEFESPVIGLPTGKTPVSFYEELTNRVREGTLDISSCRPFAIDEYIGNPANPGSNRGYFARYWDTIPGAPAVTEFDGGSAAPEEEGGRLAEALNAVGGLDVAVLGIGMNGHIAFNEPGSGTEASTRLVELAEESRAAAEEAWGGESPVQGLTLGMKELRSARTVVVLANGRHKAAIVRRAIEGEASPEVPASLLQGHPELSWLLDESAAEELGAQAR